MGLYGNYIGIRKRSMGITFSGLGLRGSRGGMYRFL